MGKGVLALEAGPAGKGSGRGRRRACIPVIVVSGAHAAAARSRGRPFTPMSRTDGRTAKTPLAGARNSDYRILHITGHAPRPRDIVGERALSNKETYSLDRSEFGCGRRKRLWPKASTEPTGYETSRVADSRGRENSRETRRGRRCPCGGRAWPRCGSGPSPRSVVRCVTHARCENSFTTRVSFGSTGPATDAATVHVAFLQRA